MTKWIEMAHEKRAHIFPMYWYWESAQYIGRVIGVEPGVYCNLYQNHEMSYLTEETGFTRVGEAIFKALKENKLIDKIEAGNNSEIPKLLTLSKWFVDNDLTQKSGEELLRQHDLVHEQFLKLMSYSAMGTVMEFERPLMSDYLEEILRKKVKDKSKVGDYFNVLTTPNRQTTPQIEEMELRRLRIKELNYNLSGEELKKHCAKYSYIAFGYDGPGWSVAEVKERLNNLSEDKRELQKQIEEIQNLPRQVEENQKKCAHELNLMETEKYLFKTLEILGYWKFERKLANQKSHEMMEKFFEELTRRLRLSLSQAKMIAPYEMRQFLVEEKVKTDLLNERIKLCIGWFDGWKSHAVLVGERAKAIAKKIEKSLAVDENITELKGACAYPGQAKGMVKRVDDENDMFKFDDGDILVSTSTTPKLIPAMKKAAAIITDSGGITCHAAIVSRELKVPCVIGTKIATRVFKDGDTVEVDATKGVIKKI